MVVGSLTNMWGSIKYSLTKEQEQQQFVVKVICFPREITISELQLPSSFFPLGLILLSQRSHFHSQTPIPPLCHHASKCPTRTFSKRNPKLTIHVESALLVLPILQSYLYPTATYATQVSP